MRKKGFTLIELLVVIAIIAMLLAILMPALNKVKSLAQRLVCGTSCKGLGTAMMVYAQDFDDEYPMQGGSGAHYWSETGITEAWWDPDKNWAIGKHLTVSSSLYLLVRIADVDPKSFVCKSGDEKAFEGVSGSANLDMVELWDFGGGELTGRSLLEQSGTVDYGAGRPGKHVSYAFQLPYDADLDRDDIRARPASATSSAGTAILADKNPWCDPKLTDGHSLAEDQKKRDYAMLIDDLNVDWLANNPPDPLRSSSTGWQIQIANSQPHGREGQNVLYGDGHTSFEKRPDVSYQNDNIYTMYGRTQGPPSFNEWDKRTGTNRPLTAPDPIPPLPSFPRTDEDTLLVNDDSRYPSAHGW